MKKNLLTASAIALSVLGAYAQGDSQNNGARSLTMYDKVVFYDGYNDNIFDADKNDGILRHRNSLYSIKLSDEQLDWAGETLKMNITIGALCDNYDRIGNINLALVPKGEDKYDPFKIERLEIGRFVTPFMDKNYRPNQVPYEFNIPYVSNIFHDKQLRQKYDLWLEFELFGIPYAANTEVRGCKDRNDVFEGTLVFETTGEPLQNSDDHVLVPIVMKKPEYMGDNLNNYSDKATDEVGKCVKTYTFSVPEDVADSQIVLVMSNHGANVNGEEYVRRLHLLTFDGEEYSSFTPGGKSCEPYRQYNTQTNGIYGPRPTDWRLEWWLTNSNWCPGDAITTRVLPLGSLKAGEHSLKINVPDAEFADKKGDFPVSMYFQGLKTGTLPSGIENVTITSPEVDVTLDGNILRFNAELPVVEVSVFSTDGKLLYGKMNPGNEISLEQFTSGVYLVNFLTDDHRSAVKKIMIK